MESQDVIFPSTQKPKSNRLTFILILIGFFSIISFIYFGFQLSHFKNNICEIGKDYINSATNPISCQCPKGYEFKVISTSWGSCPKANMHDCPQTTQTCISNFYTPPLSATAIPTTSPGLSDSYTACGCGCCDESNSSERCLYKANGDDLNKIIEEDQNLKNSPQCASVGCGLGTTYKYCD